MTVPTGDYANAEPADGVQLGARLEWTRTARPTTGAAAGCCRFVTTQAAPHVADRVRDGASRTRADFSVDARPTTCTGFFEPGRSPIDVTTDETAFDWGEEGAKMPSGHPACARPSPA